jgi:hypothetical protein
VASGIYNYQLSEQLFNLYAIEGTLYFLAQEHGYRHVKKKLTVNLLYSHVQGEMTIGVPSAFNGLAKWIGLDLDSLDKSNLRRALDVFAQEGLPRYAAFSGRKGYHVYVFLSPSAPVGQVAARVRHLQGKLEQAGVIFDKISPSWKGGDCFKLPCGLHPVTKKRCHFLDADLNEVTDPLGFLLRVQRVRLNETGYVNITTGEIVAPGEFVGGSVRLFSKACIQNLWEDGLQLPGTRHSATCTVANALARCRAIPRDKREAALLGWVERMWQKAQAQGFTTSSLEYALSEARRLWRRYYSWANYAPLCENPVFKRAMRSACENEFECKLKRNKGMVDLTLLLRLGIFNAHNARPRGLGKSALALYLAVSNIADEHGVFDYDGIAAIALPTTLLQELASLSKPTVIKHRRRLVDAGLLVKVPADEIPEVVRARVPRPFQVNFYCLPELDEQRVREILAEVRG